MDVTNKTWEDVLLEIADSGIFGFVVVVAFVSFILGGFLVWIYCTKFQNIQLQNKLSSAEDELENIKDERDQYKQKYEQLKIASKSVTDDLYVKLAQQPEKPDPALQSIFE